MSVCGKKASVSVKWIRWLLFRLKALLFYGICMMWADSMCLLPDFGYTVAPYSCQCIQNAREIQHF
ncbi:hypothetical protein BGI40_09920 [Snodgrassella communis]|nr:hypothetical protein BGI29_06535 [Snodgrassella communis]PIT26472.1 hypothetical protein BGI38_07965 [Snodgrassella communis]PIT28612.1 hypothetical protein BGI39_05400 [Snodgrassella communis]PIT31250.1 hypothetical protein BGI40_09920 [Snodgrassella communis]